MDLAGKEVYVDREKVAIFCESCRVCQHDNDRLAGCTLGAFESPCESLYSMRGCAKPSGWLAICRLCPSLSAHRTFITLSS